MNCVGCSYSNQKSVGAVTIGLVACAGTAVLNKASSATGANTSQRTTPLSTLWSYR